MKNLEVKKRIDEKMKLTRNSLVGKTTIHVGSMTTFAAASGACFKYVLNLPPYVIGMSALVGVICSIPDCDEINFKEVNDINFLKEIKKELKKGYNRFENSSEENFEEELINYKKKYYENKVK